MNRRDFIKVAVAGFGTVLSSGAAINMLNTKSVPETAPIACLLYTSPSPRD